MKSILSQEPWLHDPLVAEIPWRGAQEQAVLDLIKAGGGGQLAFGVMYHDGEIHPQPPVQRAISTVVKILEKLGHKVIEWTPPSHRRGAELAVCPTNPFTLPIPIPGTQHTTSFPQAH
jgi:amidase